MSGGCIPPYQPGSKMAACLTPDQEVVWLNRIRVRVLQFCRVLLGYFLPTWQDFAFGKTPELQEDQGQWHNGQHT